MQCHNQTSNGFFGCTSYFMPVQEEVCPLEDSTPETIKLQEKKNNGINYLPGEKLLIQLSKQRKKQNLKKQSNLDVERVTASLGRILSRV
jgi:hypothetical protein